MTDGFERFLKSLAASNAMIDRASKEEIAEVARVLAVNLGHYRKRFGVLPIEESLNLLKGKNVSDQTGETLAMGFETLIEVLKMLTVR